MSDYMIRGIDKDAYLRIIVADTTEAVEKARKIHGSSPTSTAAMGRLLTAGVIMGRMMKNDRDSMTLKLEGDGSIGLMTVVVNNQGQGKIFVANPFAEAEPYANGKLNVAGVVGTSGNFTVITDLGLKDPFIGVSPIVSGEIGEDIAYYYAKSEQTPSVVALGVLVDKDLSVLASGGYFIQLMPGADEEVISKVEHAVSKMDPISTLISKKMMPEQIMSSLLDEFEMEILEKMPVSYYCDCSRNRVEKMLKNIGRKEIGAMIREDHGCEICCHFCENKYVFSEEDLQKIFDELGETNEEG